jgi:hypothetical protein
MMPVCVNCLTVNQCLNAKLTRESKMNSKFAVLIALLAVNPSAALALPQDICKELTAQGTFDSTGTYTDKQNFELVHAILCSSKFEEYNDAKSLESNANVNIFDVLSASGGEQITATNYRKIRSNYCSSNFSTFSNSDSMITQSRTASRVIATSFVDCVRSLAGFFGYVTQSSNKEAFAIHVQLKSEGDPKFYVTEISAQGSEIACNQDAHKATPKPASRIEVVGTREFNCVNKDPRKSLLLVVNTTAGSVSAAGRAGIELLGTDATLADLTERVQRLEATSGSLREETRAGREALQSQLEKTEKDISALGSWKPNSVTPGREGIGSTCPDNMYMVGVNGTSYGTGDGYLVRLTVVCRPLNTPN